MITLSILIPSFNRANKLLRLIKTIESEISRLDIKAQIQLLVSDNGSTDGTCKMLSEFATAQYKFKYYCQKQNMGFDENIRFLYDKAQTDYVWYIADDDIPLPGSITTIFQALQDRNPDVLLFSFIQPPESNVRQFDFPEPIYSINDPFLAIKHILRYTKLSIFVMRKINFDNSNWKILDKSLGSGWYYISLAFSVLEASQNLFLAIVSEPLASCDEDYKCISYSPFPLLYMYKMALHPFVMKHQPNLHKLYECSGYCQAIQFAFAAKTGSLFPEYIEEYDNFIKELECKMYILWKLPRSLIQFIALKLRITGLWPEIKCFTNWVRSVLQVKIIK